MTNKSHSKLTAWQLLWTLGWGEEDREKWQHKERQKYSILLSNRAKIGQIMQNKTVGFSYMYSLISCTFVKVIVNIRGRQVFFFYRWCKRGFFHIYCRSQDMRGTWYRWLSVLKTFYQYVKRRYAYMWTSYVHSSSNYHFNLDLKTSGPNLSTNDSPRKVISDTKCPQTTVKMEH